MEKGVYLELSMKVTNQETKVYLATCFITLYNFFPNSVTRILVFWEHVPRATSWVVDNQKVLIAK